MLIHTEPTDILLVRDFSVVHVFRDGGLNTHKLWIAPFPSFHEVAFPFLVVSGSETFNLINVKEKRMDVLLKQPATYMQA